MVLVGVVVASLVALLTSSLPGMSEWPGAHLMKMEEEMELMEVWIGEVQGYDDMSGSHKDLLSVQKRMVIVGWLALVDVQVKADSMAVALSMQELVSALPLVLMAVTTSGWNADPLVTTAATTPFFDPPLVDALV